MIELNNLRKETLEYDDKTREDAEKMSLFVEICYELMENESLTEPQWKAAIVEYNARKKSSFTEILPRQFFQRLYQEFNKDGKVNVKQLENELLNPSSSFFRKLHTDSFDTEPDFGGEELIATPNEI